MWKPEYSNPEFNLTKTTLPRIYFKKSAGFLAKFIIFNYFNYIILIILF